jgi:hypothetical protein
MFTLLTLMERLPRQRTPGNCTVFFKPVCSLLAHDDERTSSTGSQSTSVHMFTCRPANSDCSGIFNMSPDRQIWAPAKFLFVQK